MSDEGLDDEIEKVSKQEVNDAEIEAVRKAAKKSAFNKAVQQDLQLVKTDVDAKTKTKKKGHKKHDDEDELSKVDKQPKRIRTTSREETTRKCSIWRFIIIKSATQAQKTKCI